MRYIFIILSLLFLIGCETIEEDSNETKVENLPPKIILPPSIDPMFFVNISLSSSNFEDIVTVYSGIGNKKLEYTWRLIKPFNSKAYFSSQTIDSVLFKTDVPGDYIVYLNIEGKLSDSITINVPEPLTLQYDGDIFSPDQIDSLFYNDMSIDSKGDFYAISKYVFRSGKSQPLLVKFDANGSKLWEKSFENLFLKNIILKGISIDVNDDLYIVGEYKRYKEKCAFIFKLDSEGSLIWLNDTNKFANILNILPKTLRSLNDVSIDDYGNIYAVGSSDNKARVVSFDSSGNKLWEKTIEYKEKNSFVFSSISTDNDGNIYMVSYPWVTKLDSDSNILYRRNIKDNMQPFSRDILIDTYGNIYSNSTFFAGMQQNFNSQRIIKVSENEKKLWEKTINIKVNYFKIVSIDKDNNIYALSSYGKYKTLLIKLDSNGNKLWNKFIKLH